MCRKCGEGGHPSDARLGIDGGRTDQAERLLCLAGGSWSFDRAAALLDEFCGLKVCDNTIRQVCQERAQQMAQWQQTEPEALAKFREAQGQCEFETDGTMANTTEGWREIRLGMFAKREAAAPAKPDEWADRELPKPTHVVAFAAMEKGQKFVSRWSGWSRRLGIGTKTPLHVVADAAAWIWQGVRDRFAQADGVLDIYHVLEHVAAVARVLHGEGTAAAGRWRDQSRQVLLAEGWTGIDRFLVEERRQTRRPACRAAMDELWNYLVKHRDHLDYAAQLAAGRTIGSGMVEGGCKNMLGRRLKQTGARWRVTRLNRMAALCCTLHTEQWSTYWA